MFLRRTGSIRTKLLYLAQCQIKKQLWLGKELNTIICKFSFFFFFRRTIRDVRVTVAGWTAGGILEGDGHSRPA